MKIGMVQMLQYIAYSPNNFAVFIMHIFFCSLFLSLSLAFSLALFIHSFLYKCPTLFYFCHVFEYAFIPCDPLTINNIMGDPSPYQLFLFFIVLSIDVHCHPQKKIGMNFIGQIADQNCLCHIEIRSNS